MAKQHSIEFKNDAVQYYLDNQDHMNYREAAKNLGIGVSTLQKWTKQFKE
ncbi:transposase, partial [Ligilactobacillus equi]